MPGWDDETRTWWGWEILGPEPQPWEGPMGIFEPEQGLHAYQRRNIPIVTVGDQEFLASPRPPYFSWHGHLERTGQPHFSQDEGKVAGNGVYLAQHHATALRQAGKDGEVLAFYINAPKLVLLDARWERSYSQDEAGLLIGLPFQGPITGLDLLSHLNQVHGKGSGITRFLRQRGFNGISYGATSRGEGGWCIFDPRIFKRLLRASEWSQEEIQRREAFDPTPIGLGSTWLEELPG